jgi:hypothetical protein
MLGCQLLQNLARTVARSVVDAEQFDLEWDREYSLDYLPQRGKLVVHRHDYGEFHLLLQV